MDQLPYTITLVIALLAVFLCFAVGIKYVVTDNFVRTRMVMTAFFFFIVATLTISFWQYRIDSLPYTVPAFLLGLLLGYLLGVRTEQQKLRVGGLEHYMEHFARIHLYDITALNWWSVINFYSVMGGLLLINLVGLSTVIFRGNAQSAIRTAMVGALLLGTIVPYLIHLWSIRAPHHAKRTASEQ